VLSWSDASNNESIQQGKAGWIHNPVSAYIIAKQRKLVTDPQAILHFAEFGVVLMLFLVGLELEPRRLWALRRPIFGWGSVQLLGCAVLSTGVAVLVGVDWRVALVAALGLAIAYFVVGALLLVPVDARRREDAPAGSPAAEAV